jgi:hypothetical protein
MAPVHGVAGRGRHQRAGSGASEGIPPDHRSAQRRRRGAGAAWPERRVDARRETGNDVRRQGFAHARGEPVLDGG